MKSVYDTIAACAADSGKKAKLAILQSQVDNEDLKKFLRATYEPRINYYSKKVDPAFKVDPHYAAVDNVFSAQLVDEIIDKIAKRKLTGHSAKSYLSSVFHSFDNKYEQILLEMLIQRDCRAGFSASTINKVWPGLVTDTPYMRSSLPKDLPKNSKLESWDWVSGVYSQIKADGMFATISHHSKTSNVTIESRSGSPFPTELFEDLITDIQNYVPTGMQLHGELLVRRNGKILARQIGNGILNSVLQGGEFDAGDVPIYQAWDIIPIAEAKAKNVYSVPYKDRLCDLEDLGFDDSSTISVIEYKVVFSLKEAYAHCKEVMGRGLEGTVIKNQEMFWEDKTSLGQVKLKLLFDIDLKMVSLKAADHKSKHIATFGSIECESSCGKLKVAVTGIPDDMRAEIFKDWLIRFKDNVMSVSCNGVMEPSTNNEFYSLFLPRRNVKVLELPRLDKFEADSLERILAIQASAIELADVIG